MLRSQANLRPLISQGVTYLILLAFIGAFVMIVNWYNMKQLAQLKEEYGFDERKPSPEFWWRKSVIYHICIHSFQDSNGDGIGDLNGIRQHLDHLVYLGVDAVLLSSMFDSSIENIGRDVLDFNSVNAKYGTLQDFESLVAELHERGMKVMIEIVPNHTGRRHKWFLASRQSGLNNSYRSYYIWNRGIKLPNGTRIPPNNWVSRYGGSAWTFDEERQQFYYHYYHHTMPDLNLRDKDVRLEVLNIFKYWLNKGIDAIYISNVHVLYESDDLQLDEPLTDPDSAASAGFNSGYKAFATSTEEAIHHIRCLARFSKQTNYVKASDDYTSLKHIYTEHQPDVHDFLGSWRDFIETYSVQSGRRIGLIVDVGDSVVSEVVKYYFTGPDAPVSRALLNANGDCAGRCLHENVDSWLTHLPEDRDTIWRVNGPDHQRLASRKGARYQTPMNMLGMLLPGATISLYGDEIGLDDTHMLTDLVRHSESKGKLNVKFAIGQTPMQWTSGKQAGFTTSNQSCLPVHPQFDSVNVQVQSTETTGRSPLKIYQRLARLRKERSFIGSKIQFLIVDANVLSFLRFARDSAPYLIALNFGHSSSSNDYSVLTGVGHGKVVLYYGNEYQVKDGDLIALSQLTLKPGEGIVVVLVTEDDIEKL